MNIKKLFFDKIYSIKKEIEKTQQEKLEKKKIKRDIIQKQIEQQDFKCKECEMRFNDSIRLEVHFKVAHKPKHDGFKQKWYWEN